MVVEGADAAVVLDGVIAVLDRLGLGIELNVEETLQYPPAEGDFFA
jgi:hypothetical protein